MLKTLHGGKQAKTILDMQQKQVSKEPTPHMIAWMACQTSSQLSKKV